MDAMSCIYDIVTSKPIVLGKAMVTVKPIWSLEANFKILVDFLFLLNRSLRFVLIRWEIGATNLY